MTRARAGCLAGAWLVLTFWSAARAEQSGPAVPGAPGVIAGRVVDAHTGEPIAGARVNVNWVNPPRATRAAMLDPRIPPPGLRGTDAAGRFEYSGVGPGRFRLSVSAPGYLGSAIGKQAAWEGFTSSVEHELAPSERLTDLVIRMWPTGSISGTVRDERGEPVVKATVELLKRVEERGHRTWRRDFSRGETDDRGRYRLGGLVLNISGTLTLPGPAAGEYLVLVRPAAPAVGASVFDGPVFAPGVRLAAAAQTIVLGDGEHRTGVDVVVQTGAPAGRFSVAGRLVAAPRLRAPLRVHLVPTGSMGELAAIESFTADADAAGRFVFGGIPAGEYRLQAWHFPELSAQAVRVTPGGGLHIPDRTAGGSRRPLAPLPAADTWVADMPLTIDGRVDNLAVPMRAGARVKGRISFDGDSRPPAADELVAVPVALFPAGRDMGLIPVTRLEADGRFVSVGLPPEQYRLDVGLREHDRLAPVVWWPQTVTVDGRPVIFSGLIDVGMQDVELQITYTDRRAVLAGTVRDRAGRPRPDARIILFTADPRAPTPCERILAPDRAGTFEINAATGADCRAAAVLSPPEDWRSDEYLKTLVPFAVPFRMEVGQTRTVHLSVGP
jgi:protocatechuate 3,4-dioxygenase beta subunit